MYGLKTGKESTLTSTQGSMGICADNAGNIIVQNESGTFGTQTGDFVLSVFILRQEERLSI